MFETNDYLDWMNERHLASNTIRAYTFTVRQYFQLFPALTAPNLALYKIYLMEHYKPQTVNLRIRALNAFLKYQNSPLPRLSMVKIQQKLFLDKIISQADYAYLKRRLWEDEEYTYFFLIWLIAATGVRVSELVTFCVEDAERGYKDIYSKGNKMRRIFLPSTLRAQVLSWTSGEYRFHGPLFLNRYGVALSVAGIRSRLKDFAGRYQIDPAVMYPHSFRHRFARNFIEHCDDIALLSDLLGHESIETTRIYLRRSSLEQRQLVNEVVNW